MLDSSVEINIQIIVGYLVDGAENLESVLIHRELFYNEVLADHKAVDEVSADADRGQGGRVVTYFFIVCFLFRLIDRDFRVFLLVWRVDLIDRTGCGPFLFLLFSFGLVFLI